MRKLPTPEIIDYFQLYGVAPLLMPIAFFIATYIVLFPLIIINLVGTIPESADSLMNLLFPIIKIVLGIGVFLLYVISTKRLIKKYNGARADLFAIFFIGSALINFFFSYFTCAISVLKPCNPAKYLTFSGLLEISDFYIIALAAFVSVYLYLRHASTPIKLK